MSQSNLDLIDYNILILNRFLNLIDLLDQPRWIKKNKSINNESVSRHVRHVYNFYECFLCGFNSRKINYDARVRDNLFEKDISYARIKISTLIKEFSLIDSEDFTLEILLNNSIANSKINSTLRRELMGLIDHSIHHGHILQIAIKNEFKDIDFKDKFYSPSTLESSTCVK